MIQHGVARSTRVRTTEQREQDIEKIHKYRDLENQLRSRVSGKLFEQETFALTSRLLRLNPEYYTVWNVRRRCIMSELLSRPSSRTAPSLSTEHQSSPSSAGVDSSHLPSDLSANTSIEVKSSIDEKTLRSELGFTVPLLIEYPKCYWIWKYRMWVLDQATALLSTEAARSIWQEELGLVSKMLDRDQRNFHAWSYRRYVVSQLESAALAGKSMIEFEFDFTTKKIENDLSNFSAWHYRSQMIPRLLQERDLGDEARRSFLDSELNLVRGALNVGPEDQSLWYYHQFLISPLSETGSSCAITPDLPTADRKNYLLDEIAYIEEIAEDYQDIKWIYEALIECTLAIGRIEGRSLQEDERRNVAKWFRKLREMDQKRGGRWDDLEIQLCLK
ncbi:hypothetical protein HIM_08598 [Hirsutella minnesotensis 3608]|uniref:Geranylgeranyl transferase type-2 subunit alpha n=1 Tax=Hirsutella minnesotensis 3608 TaxID=1043627 RepID=A0A0F7ZY86_9HYPO|nr:hypothetical protein HIM_08598 [Hirsutella minnesotensis 3608]